MNTLLYIGQWQGFFQYGPEYGEIVGGKEAEFRLFIEEFKEGQFSGRIIDWEGFGVNGETADVKGFISEEFISFTKQYSQFFIIDELGKSEVLKDLPGHKVVYEGRFDKKSNSFVGSWEIAVVMEDVAEYTFNEISTGTWRMNRHN